MRRRTLRLAARGSFAITLSSCLGTVVFLALAWKVPKLGNEFGFKGYAIAYALVVGGLGLLLADRQPQNPTGLDEPWLPGAANASIGLMLPVLFGGAAAATVRFRRRRGDERQQIKWLLLAVTAVGLVLAYYGILLATGTGTDPNQGWWGW